MRCVTNPVPVRFKRIQGSCTGGDPAAELGFGHCCARKGSSEGVWEAGGWCRKRNEGPKFCFWLRWTEGSAVVDLVTQISFMGFTSLP